MCLDQCFLIKMSDVKISISLNSNVWLKKLFSHINLSQCHNSLKIVFYRTKYRVKRKMFSNQTLESWITCLILIDQEPFLIRIDWLLGIQTRNSTEWIPVRIPLPLFRHLSDFFSVYEYTIQIIGLIGSQLQHMVKKLEGSMGTNWSTPRS